MARAKGALAAAQAADDVDAELRAAQALSDAKLAFDYAKADHDLLCSEQPLSAEQRYRLMANEQRGGRRASPAQRQAMEDYVAVSDRFYRCLSDPDRMAVDERTRTQIGEIRRLLGRSILDEDITVYRVMRADAPADAPVFLSTTTDPEFAAKFLKQQGGGGSHVIKRIQVAAGSRALFMNNAFEREVLLDGADSHPMEEWHPAPAAG